MKIGLTFRVITTNMTNRPTNQPTNQQTRPIAISPDGGNCSVDCHWQAVVATPPAAWPREQRKSRRRTDHLGPNDSHGTQSEIAPTPVGSWTLHPQDTSAPTKLVPKRPDTSVPGPKCPNHLDTSAPSLSRITGGAVSRTNCSESEVSRIFLDPMPKCLVAEVSGNSNSPVIQATHKCKGKDVDLHSASSCTHL